MPHGILVPFERLKHGCIMACVVCTFFTWLLYMYVHVYWGVLWESMCNMYVHVYWGVLWDSMCNRCVTINEKWDWLSECGCWALQNVICCNYVTLPVLLNVICNNYLSCNHLSNCVMFAALKRNIASKRRHKIQIYVKRCNVTGQL